MKCTHCGRENDAMDSFCRFCGQPLIPSQDEQNINVQGGQAVPPSQPAYNQQANIQPTYNQPTYNQPTYNQSTYNQPTYNQSQQVDYNQTQVLSPEMLQKYEQTQVLDSQMLKELYGQTPQNPGQTQTQNYGQAQANQAQQAAKTKKEKQKAAKQKAAGEKPPKKKGKAGLFVALLVILAALVGAGAWFGIPYMNLSKAQQAIEDKEFDEAISLCEKELNHAVWGEQAKETYDKAYHKKAEAALKKKDYDTAIEIYQKYQEDDKVKEVREMAAQNAYDAGDYAYAAQLYEDLGEQEKAKEVWLTYADKMRQEKQFGSAIDVYEKYGNKDAILETQKEWAEQSVKDKDYDKAIELYGILGDKENVRWVTIEKAKHLITEGNEDEVPKLLSQFTGEDIAIHVFSAFKSRKQNLSNDDAATLAGQYGSYLHDINTQLSYCNLLKKEGVDLKKVYPNGVEVNVALYEYQFYNMDNWASSPGYQNVLVFSRTDDKPMLQSKTTGTEKEQEKYADELYGMREKSSYSYHVTLEPGLMADWPEKNVADSWDRCDTIIIFEHGYVLEGALTISSYSYLDFLKENPTEYEIYPHYMSYAGIFAYNKRNPKGVELLSADANYSLAYNCVFGNTYDDLGIDLESMNIEEIVAALEDEESEESQKILSQYDKEVLDLIKSDSPGTYALFPDYDEAGNVKNFKGTSDNVSEWFTEKYMIGKPIEDDFMRDWKTLTDLLK